MLDIWNYKKNFALDTPLDPGHPFLVDLNAARGEYHRGRLLREFGFQVGRGVLQEPVQSYCVLFGGHRGCGKSTELREIARQLEGPEAYFVVQIDALKSLDINNLQYADLALSMAEGLLEAARLAGLEIPPVFLTTLLGWFKQTIKSTNLERSQSAELQAEVELKAELPFISKLFASLRTAIRDNTTHKTEIRESVRNSFSDLAKHFNALLAKLEEEVAAQHKGQGVLFVVDGTDRLSADEACAFFIQDIHQMRLLQANCIYCAPISVLNEQGQVSQNFDAVFRLPMIKLGEKGAPVSTDPSSRIPAAWAQLREFVHRRLPAEGFDHPDTLDVLIAHSGGHPRDLLRLIKLCFQQLDEGPITRSVAETAARLLSNEYRRLVQPEDWPVLASIDQGPKEDTPNTPQTRRLLYDLVLLEYNGYWWQTHPAVRALPGYPKPAATP
ncbi:MAG: hypothetical protein ACRCTU_06570 [Zoogloea sp.]|uniref:hypothetical protein n=1 Tax=Zoogloea sp. TaxID=49181 RepID=UPI003F30C2B6